MVADTIFLLRLRALWDCGIISRLINKIKSTKFLIYKIFILLFRKFKN